MKFYKHLAAFCVASVLLIMWGLQKPPNILASYVLKQNAHHSLRSLASQAYTEDSNTVYFLTSDLSLITDSIVRCAINVTGVPRGEQVTITNSNEKVVGFKDNLNAKSITAQTGDTLELRPKGFGRSAISFIPKKSPGLRNSFAVYINNYTYRYADSIFNASIYPEGGLNYLEPADTASRFFMKTKQRFIALSTQKASNLAQLEWEVKTLGDDQFATRIKLNEARDTAEIYFSRGAGYIIYLVHKNKQSKDVIDSCLFSVNMAKDETADMTTGVKIFLTDVRDGQKYKLHKFLSTDGVDSIMMTEPIRYLPHVAKMGTPLRDTVNFTDGDYIFVLGNDTTTNPDVIRPHLNSRSQVFYNHHMVANLPVGERYREYTPIPGITRGGVCPAGTRLFDYETRRDFTSIGGSNMPPAFIDYFRQYSVSPTISAGYISLDDNNPPTIEVAKLNFPKAIMTSYFEVGSHKSLYFEAYKYYDASYQTRGLAGYAQRKALGRVICYYKL